MKYEVIIVRYGEIGLKARSTRKRFIKILVNNIKNALNNMQISFKIKNDWDRIYIHTSQIDESLDVLKKIFGISSISPAVQTESRLELISKLAITISKSALSKQKSFALRVTRTGEHEFTSQDAAVEIGNNIVNSTNANVNLTKPDFELFIEIRKDKAFLFTEKINGMGGLPIGSQGTILAVINDIESILAAWYLIRRGCNVIFVTKDKSILGDLESFTMNWHMRPNIKLIKSGDIYKKLHQLSSKHDYTAIVTSHDLNEKPRKSLEDIKLLKKHTKLAILQPLIAMRKDEISNKCREIGL